MSLSKQLLHHILRESEWHLVLVSWSYRWNSFWIFINPLITATQHSLYILNLWWWPFISCSWPLCLWRSWYCLHSEQSIKLDKPHRFILGLNTFKIKFLEAETSPHLPSSEYHKLKIGSDSSICWWGLSADTFFYLMELFPLKNNKRCDNFFPLLPLKQSDSSPEGSW